jgi:hypothetical protein
VPGVLPGKEKANRLPGAGILVPEVPKVNAAERASAIPLEIAIFLRAEGEGSQ